MASAPELGALNQVRTLTLSLRPLATGSGRALLCNQMVPRAWGWGQPRLLADGSIAPPKPVAAISPSPSSVRLLSEPVVKVSLKRGEILSALDDRELHRYELIFELCPLRNEELPKRSRHILGLV